MIGTGDGDDVYIRADGGWGCQGDAVDTRQGAEQSVDDLYE